LREHRYFIQTSGAAASNSTSLQSRVSELEIEVASLREQLGNAKGLNDAMWEGVVQKVLVRDGQSSADTDMDLDERSRKRSRVVKWEVKRGEMMLFARPVAKGSKTRESKRSIYFEMNALYSGQASEMALRMVDMSYRSMLSVITTVLLEVFLADCGRRLIRRPISTFDHFALPRLLYPC
jgi:hypothetical protein